MTTIQTQSSKINTIYTKNHHADKDIRENTAFITTKK